MTCEFAEDSLDHIEEVSSKLREQLESLTDPSECPPPKGVFVESPRGKDVGLPLALDALVR